MIHLLFIAIILKAPIIMIFQHWILISLARDSVSLGIIMHKNLQTNCLIVKIIRGFIAARPAFRIALFKANGEDVEEEPKENCGGLEEYNNLD